VLPEFSEVPVTVTCAHGRWNETQLFNEALQLAQYWNAWVWGVESVAAQRLFIPLFNLLVAQQQLSGQIEVVPLTTGSQDSKVSRISAWVSLMSKGEWGLGESDVDVTEQILNYNFTKKEQPDDRIDACAYGPLMMEDYLGFIETFVATGSMMSVGPDYYGAEMTRV
jgi:hypothetical protein